MFTINSTFTLNNELTKSSDVKEELEITSTADDVYIGKLIKRASGAIERYTDRKFERVAVTETLQAEGGMFLRLSRRPVWSISQITHDGTTISSTTYEIDDPHAGILLHEVGWTNTLLKRHVIEPVPFFVGPRDWSVKYVGGFYLPNSTASGASASTQFLPDDIQQACIETVKAWYLMRRSNPRVRTQEIGDARESLFSPLNQDAFGLPNSAVALLSRWRVNPLV